MLTETTSFFLRKNLTISKLFLFVNRSRCFCLNLGHVNECACAIRYNFTNKFNIKLS